MELVIGETKSAASELLAQNPVLLPQRVDRLLLLVIHPAGNGDHQEPKRVEDRHRSTLSRDFKNTGHLQLLSACSSLLTLRGALLPRRIFPVQNIRNS
jgi:hypothetical protein